jgi:hypothetical protein
MLGGFYMGQARLIFKPHDTSHGSATRKSRVRGVVLGVDNGPFNAATAGKDIYRAGGPKPGPPKPGPP